MKIKFLAMAFLAFAGNAMAQTETVLHSFAGGMDGDNATFGGVILGQTSPLNPNPPVIGTTLNLGAHSWGTVWNYSTTIGGGETVPAQLANLVYGPAISVAPNTLLWAAGNGSGVNTGAIYVSRLVSGSWTTSTVLSTGVPTNVNQLVQTDATHAYGFSSNGGTNGNGNIFLLTSANSAWSSTVTYTDEIDFSVASGAPFETSSSNGASYDATNGFIYFSAQNGTSPYPGALWSYNVNYNTVSLVYTFSGSNQIPEATVIDPSAQVIYGTCKFGGTNNQGTVWSYKISNGTYTVLHTFAGPSGDGANPNGALALSQTSPVALYGTTSKGGILNGSIGQYNGVVWKLSGTGTTTETIEHYFASTSDGYQPQQGVVLTGGNLYGSTEYGGANNYGTIFEITSP